MHVLPGIAYNNLNPITYYVISHVISAFQYYSWFIHDVTVHVLIGSQYQNARDANI